jgi:hypothetical protein
MEGAVRAHPLDWKTFDVVGRTLIAVPNLPGEESHVACRRCIRNDSEGFRCLDLPACAGVYFQFADQLTPQDSARLVLHKLEK